jgi:hypothetical protein
MDQYAIAQILRVTGSIIELTGLNPKKGIAHQRATHSSESIEDFERVV